MTLQEAYEITDKMTGQDHKNPSLKQQDAKWLIYKEVIKPKFAGKDGNVPPYMEPDFNEGWN